MSDEHEPAEGAQNPEGADGDGNELRDRIPAVPPEPVEPPAPEPEPDAPPPPPGPTVEEVTGKLGSAKLMQVERVVWCISHAAVHAETTDPYGVDTAADTCDPNDHRPVYYRARKGDPAEMPEEAQIIVDTGDEEPTLSDVEKAVLANLAQERYRKVETNRNEARELFGEGYDLGAHDVLMSVLSSAFRSLRGED